MSIRDFFHGGGRITFENQFVSLRLIKEALGKKYTIQILDESTNGLSCKVTRYVRLYAAPMPFPNPSVEVWFKNEGNETVIDYRITDYDYYLVLIVFLLAMIGSVGLGLKDGLIEALRVGLLFSLLSLIFFGSLVLIDARVFACRIKSALLKLDK